MLDLPPLVFNGLAIVLGLGLYAVSWWLLRDLPLAMKILGRVLMLFVVLLPFALLITVFEKNGGPMAPPPFTDEYAESEVEKPKEPAKNEPEEKTVEEESPTDTDKEARKPETPPSANGSGSDDVSGGEGGGGSSGDEAGGEVGGASAPSSETERADSDEAKPGSAKSRKRATRSLETTEKSTSGSSPNEIGATVADEKEKSEWDVVPVYFGTDRAREPSEKRLEYNANRARRLELGRALVTVPRVHQIPNIERPWKITIPYFNVTVYEEDEDPKKHFTMQEIKSMTQEQLMVLVRERIGGSKRFKDHALVFIHGYNTSFDLAVYRTAQIAYDIDYDGAPFVYSWPSGGNVASYTYDLGSAAQSEPYLREFLTMVSQKSGATRISVIAHSMGNQPLLRVLQDFTRTSPPGIKIDQLILAAPDVDSDTFENIASTLQPLADGITLYAASNDRALNASESFHRSPRAGDVPEDGPIILQGLDTIDVSAISMDSLGLHHSGYAENNKLLQDIGRLIETGQRPPNLRVPGLEVISTEKGSYWRYPAVP
ncbi:MAG: alpha/beta hydrolase [Hyphomicrobiaceae bacterium]